MSFIDKQHLDHGDKVDKAAALGPSPSPSSAPLPLQRPRARTLNPRRAFPRGTASASGAPARRARGGAGARSDPDATATATVREGGRRAPRTASVARRRRMKRRLGIGGRVGPRPAGGGRKGPGAPAWHPAKLG